MCCQNALYVWNSGSMNLYPFLIPFAYNSTDGILLTFLYAYDVSMFYAVQRPGFGRNFYAKIRVDI